jgi:hypothetical protein
MSGWCEYKHVCMDTSTGTTYTIHYTNASSTGTVHHTPYTILTHPPQGSWCSCSMRRMDLARDT